MSAVEVGVEVEMVGKVFVLTLGPRLRIKSNRSGMSRNTGLGTERHSFFRRSETK